MSQSMTKSGGVTATTTLPAGAKVTAKDPTTKLAHQRLSVLQLAEALGSVSEACRRMGMDRTSFYEWKRRFQTHGLAGLKDLPPVHKSHPQTTPEETAQKILEVALAHPTRGCVWLSNHLDLQGIHVSSPTIQGILIKHQLGSRYERLLKLEERAAQQAIELTPAQVALIEKANPAFRERHVESSRPGEVVSQDTF
jgi:transposase-like protein